MFIGARSPATPDDAGQRSGDPSGCWSGSVLDRHVSTGSGGEWWDERHVGHRGNVSFYSHSNPTFSEDLEDHLFWWLFWDDHRCRRMLVALVVVKDGKKEGLSHFA